MDTDNMVSLARELGYGALADEIENTTDAEVIREALAVSSRARAIWLMQSISAEPLTPTQQAIQDVLRHILHLDEDD